MTGSKNYGNLLYLFFGALIAVVICLGSQRRPHVPVWGTIARFRINAISNIGRQITWPGEIGDIKNQLQTILKNEVNDFNQEYKIGEYEGDVYLYESPKTGTIRICICSFNKKTTMVITKTGNKDIFEHFANLNEGDPLDRTKQDK